MTTTEQRFQQLKQYCVTERLEPGGDFGCTNRDSCKEDRPEGTGFEPGGLAYIGSEYDAKVNGTDIRVRFVGYDYGNCSATLEARRECIESLNDLNRHYKGIVKLQMEIFEVECGAIEHETIWQPLLRKMAQTNATRCCAPRDHQMRTHTTTPMRRNCWPHFRKELELLEPTMVIFHGANLKWLVLEKLKEEQIEAKELYPEFDGYCREVNWRCFSRPFTSLLLFFRHPACGWFGRQWNPPVVPLVSKLKASGLTVRKRASDEDRSLTFAAPIRAPNVREGLRKAPNYPVRALARTTRRPTHYSDIFQREFSGEPLAGRLGASGAEALLRCERQHGQSRVTGETGGRGRRPLRVEPCSRQC